MDHQATRERLTDLSTALTPVTFKRNKLRLCTRCCANIWSNIQVWGRRVIDNLYGKSFHCNSKPWYNKNWLLLAGLYRWRGGEMLSRWCWQLNNAKEFDKQDCSGTQGQISCCSFRKQALLGEGRTLRVCHLKHFCLFVYSYTWLLP